MEFNKGKLIVLRYGENEALKNETEYFSGEYDEIIERKESLRDLADDGTFGEQLEKVCKKDKKVAVLNFLLKKHSIPKTGFQIFGAATHRLLLTAVDPLRGTKLGKGFERFLQEDPGAERNELLGEAGEVGNELRA